MRESLDKAIHDMGFACGDLREALKTCSNVESIIVLDLIGRASVLSRDIDRLRSEYVNDMRLAEKQESK